MAVFQVLSKVIGAEELLGVVAFAEFVHVIQVFGAYLPIRRHWKLFTAITAYIGYAQMGLRGVECRVRACECSARPRVTPEMERILVPFCFVLVLEPVRAKLASVLLLQFVHATRLVSSANSHGNGGGAIPWDQLTVVLPRCRISWAFSGSIRTCNRRRCGWRPNSGESGLRYPWTSFEAGDIRSRRVLAGGVVLIPNRADWDLVTH